MKARPIVCVGLTLIVMFVLTGAGQQSAEQLYKSGLYEEEVGGDLQKAIAIYQDILKRFPDSREIAAKAQLHIGLCFEKSGAQEAQKAFQKVIENYPEQAEAVRQAKDKLAVLLGARAPVRPGDTDFKLRQVWTGPETDTCGAVSPDGRYLSFVDWTTGDLAIRELATGTNRRLTNKGSWQQSPEFALFSKWSPDGRRIVYQWYTKDELFELLIMDVENTAAGVLYQCNNKEEYVHPFDWSPDGKSILAGIYATADSSVGHMSQLSLISVADGSVKVLKKGSELNNAAPKIWGFVFSPDGKYIAYDISRDAKAYENRDIVLLSADGNTETPLIEHPAADTVFDWTPDGRGLLFVSDRTGTQDIWLIRLAGSQPQGEPLLLKPGLGRIEPMGVTLRGALYYGLSGNATDVYEVGIDPRTGKISIPVKKAALTYEGQNAYPDYSPDGKFLAYMTIPGMPTARPRRTINILSLETGENRGLSPSLMEYSFPRWAPDGRSIALEGIDPETRVAGIFRMDVQTAAVAPIVKFPKGMMAFSHRWSKDGKAICYTLGDRAERTCSVFIHDLETGGDEKLSGAPENAHDIDISPDGKWLVLMNRQEKRVIWIMPTSGGEPREIYSFEQEGSQIMTPAWSADGRYIYFAKLQKPRGAMMDLYRVSVEGGEAQKIDLSTNRFRHFTVHPDGKRLAFSSMGANPEQSQVWVMENFLPKDKAKK